MKLTKCQRAEATLLAASIKSTFFKIPLLFLKYWSRGPNRKYSKTSETLLDNVIPYKRTMALDWRYAYWPANSRNS
jgi:hypothetical protein